MPADRPEKYILAKPVVLELLSTTMALVPPRPLGAVSCVDEEKLPEETLQLLTVPPEAYPIPAKSRDVLLLVKYVSGEHSEAAFAVGVVELVALEPSEPLDGLKE